VQSLEKQRADLRARLTRLNDEHRELSAEFAQFRADKERQEAARNAQYQALEERITTQQQADAARNDELKSQIATLENSSEVLQKENSILLLRQKYLKQSTATLAKQKVFLFETLAKGEGEIRETLQRMENAMLADNNNQAYLVSVEKCIKQAKKMADMGTGALQNISQILQFLKIEKLHQLLSDEDELEQIERELLEGMQADGGQLPLLAEEAPASRPARAYAL
jgi:chromosome segregation ATPase